jgi:4-amino-4-deoxy-L-arabinose transferase-like glycosyltransferase
VTRRTDLIAAFVLLIFLGCETFLKASVPVSFLKTSALIVGLLSWLFIVYYFSRNSELWSGFSTSVPASRRTFYVVAAMVVIGFIFRFWRIGSLFDGMAWDEAYKGLDALAIRVYGDRPVFLNWNAGREALIAYLVVVFQWLFDFSIISVRGVLAFFGGLTLIVIFFLCRRLFNLHFALLATFLLTVSKWHIIHTRYGVRVSLIIFFEVMVLLLLARGIQSNKRGTASFALAGFFGGLGLYTYIAYRIFPAIAVAFLLSPGNRQKLKQNWRGLVAGAFIAVVVVAPLLNFYWKNRESFNDRIQRTAVWKTRGTDLSPAALIVDSTLKTLGLFTYHGDPIDRHNVNEEPMLSPFACGFFLLGIGITLVNFRKRYAVFLLLYLFFTILPGILSVDSPHSSRTVGSVIPAILFTTVGLVASFNLLAKLLPLLGTILLATVLGGSFYTGSNDGLLRYADHLDRLDPKTSALWGMDRDQFRVVQLLNQLGPRLDPHLSVQYYFHASIEYLTYEKSKHKLYAPGTTLKDTWKEKKLGLIIVQPEECNLWWLRDDDRKRFFKWWDQKGPFDVKSIRLMVQRSYGNPFKTTNMSDARVIQSIKKNFPHARELKMDSFTVFLIGPPNRVHGGPRPQN